MKNTNNKINTEMEEMLSKVDEAILTQEEKPFTQEECDAMYGTEYNYVVMRNGCRVSDSEHASEKDAQFEYNYWIKLLKKWPDGSKIEIKKIEKMF